MFKGTILKSTANEIGTMLNGKLGVTTGFKPSEWASAINLLAKCPEKTVSGNIVSITDGAKDVPLKNCICNIPASLTGTTSIDVFHTGKNIAKLVQDILDHDSTSNGVTYHATSENTLHISGTATSNSWMTTTYTYNSPQLKLLRKGTYTLSSNVVTGTSTSGARISGYYKGQTTITHFSSYARSGTKRTFTLDDDAYIWITMTIPNGDTIDMDVWVQIEVGSTATSYEAYNGSTDTISLGQTLYGGSVDVVTGAVTKSWERKLGSEFQLWQKHNSGYFYCIASYTGKASGQENVMCDGLTTTTTSQMTTTDYSISGRTQDGAIYVRLTGSETLEEFQSWIDDKNIAYELETPVTAEITPIQMSTFEGANTIFNSAGDTSVTYRRDPTLALAQYENAPLMMMSPMLMSNNNEESEVEEDGNDIQE